MNSGRHGRRKAIQNSGGKALNIKIAEFSVFVVFVNNMTIPQDVLWPMHLLTTVLAQTIRDIDVLQLGPKGTSANKYGYTPGAQYHLNG